MSDFNQDHDQEDPLRTMRGITFGVILGSMIWVVVIAAVIYWIFGF